MLLSSLWPCCKSIGKSMSTVHIHPYIHICICNLYWEFPCRNRCPAPRGSTLARPVAVRLRCTVCWQRKSWARALRGHRHRYGVCIYIQTHTHIFIVIVMVIVMIIMIVTMTITKNNNDKNNTHTHTNLIWLLQDFGHDFFKSFISQELLRQNQIIISNSDVFRFSP